VQGRMTARRQNARVCTAVWFWVLGLRVYPAFSGIIRHVRPPASRMRYAVVRSDQAMTHRVGSGETLSRHINHRGLNTGPAPTVRMFAVFTCRAVSKRVHNLMERWAVTRLIGPRKRREE